MKLCFIWTHRILKTGRNIDNSLATHCHTKIQVLQYVMNEWLMKDPHFQLQMRRRYQIIRIAPWIRFLGEPQTPPFVPLSWFCFNQSQHGEKQSWSAPVAAVFENPTETFSSPTTAIKKKHQGDKDLAKDMTVNDMRR